MFRDGLDEESNGSKALRVDGGKTESRAEDVEFKDHDRRFSRGNDMFQSVHIVSCPGMHWRER